MKKEQILTAVSIILAVGIVYLAAAYKMEWPPFVPPEAQPPQQDVDELPDGLGSLELEVVDLIKLEKRAQKLMGNRLRIDLFFHGAERSEFDPTGCAASPMGGLSKYAAYIKASKRKAAAQILVHAGNALSNTRYPQSIREKFKLQEKAKAFFAYFSTMNYTALNVGRLELALGRDFLVENAKKYNLPYISANLLSSDTNQALFKPYIITEVEGIKFGFIGLFPYDLESKDEKAQAKLREWEKKEGIEVVPAEEVLDQIIEEMRANGTQVIVVLSSRPMLKDINLANSFSGKIDFIINAGGYEATLKPTIRKDVVILATGSGSAHLGQLIMYPGKKLRPFRYLFEEYDLIESLISLNNRLDELNTEITNLKEKLDKAKEGKEWEEIRQKLVSKENVRKGIYEQMQAKSEKLKQVQQFNPEYSYFWLRLQPVHSKLKPDPTIENILKPIRESVAHIDEDPRFGGVPIEAGWGNMASEKHVGSIACAQCHSSIYQLWLETKHAKAYKVLKDKDRANPECLVCHTTGWMRNGAVTSPNDIKPEFAAVGCESCHGPGEIHVRKFTQNPKQDISYIQRKVFKPLCATCHRQYHKDEKPFDYTKMLPQVSCTELAKKKGIKETTVLPPNLQELIKNKDTGKKHEQNKQKK